MMSREPAICANCLEPFKETETIGWCAFIEYDGEYNIIKRNVFCHATCAKDFLNKTLGEQTR
jgi:hypothetical protein